MDLSGFDALDPAAAAALTEPTADLSALSPAAAAEVTGGACSVKIEKIEKSEVFENYEQIHTKNQMILDV